MKASLDVTEEELQMFRGNESLEEKLSGSPLRDMMFSLVDPLETDSEESQSQEKQKNTMASTIIYNPISISQIAEYTPAPSIPPQSQLHYPISYYTPSGKRKISERSFGNHSTETTPAKLIHPEVKVQALQNTFVKIIINTLWLGKINIHWARGCQMFLAYTEFALSF